jgi:excinuclease ABC subunit C
MSSGKKKEPAGSKRRVEPDETSSQSMSSSELKRQVGRLPKKPGVYIMRDADDRVIYVGKARNLRARVRSYFRKSGDTRYFVRLLDQILARVDFIVTSNDKEAVLLESNLIKQYRPRYNIQLRDDKSYLLIRLDVSKPFPRLDVARKLKKDKARYFGPFHSARAARTVARFVSKHFGLRICRDRQMKGRDRPCIQYHMGRCAAPCCMDVDPEEYGARVSDAILFLSGHKRKLVANLRQRMEEASEKLEFERAASLRDQIQAIQKVVEPQNVISVRQKDQDVVGIHREGNKVEVCLLEVRAGRLVGRRSFLLKRQEFPDPEVVSSFLGLYYMSGKLPPAEVLVGVDIEDDGGLEDVLSERRGTSVQVRRPRRGSKRRLVEMASRNARESYARRVEGPDGVELVEALARRLRLSRPPGRMECFDISHTRGGEVRGSMSVFLQGRPVTGLYRLFRVEGVAEGDDYEALRQVIGRRLRRAKEEKEGWELPELMVIDGGKGQLKIAQTVLEELSVQTGPGGVELLSIAKGPSPSSRAAGREPSVDQPVQDQVGHAAEPPARYVASEPAEEDHLYRPNVKDPIPVRTPELLLVAHLRDEAHRFAIKHHRKARRKQAFGSELESISGVGPARRRRLLRELGSVEAIGEASVEQLVEAGLPERVAQRVRAHFFERGGDERE